MFNNQGINSQTIEKIAEEVEVGMGMGGLSCGVYLEITIEVAKRYAELIVRELESNPNKDGSISPNIQHWVEQKQEQLRKIIKK